MKVTGIETARVRWGPESKSWRSYIRLLTDAGIDGIGQVQSSHGLDDVIAQARGLLIGANPLDISVNTHKFIHRNGYSGGWVGWSVQVWSAIETAMWDIAGKAYGVPIAQLLGGKYRDRVRVYADLHAGASRAPADWAETAKRAVDRGFTAIKFDVDSFVHGFTGGGWEERRPVSNLELYEMVEQIGAVREAVGSSVDIAVDCHWSFSVADAIRIGWALSQFDLLFFEDPVQLGDNTGLKEVSDAVPCPVGCGEKQHTTVTWLQLLETRAISIALPDFMDGGGIGYGRDLAHMCEIRSIPLCPHNFSDAIGSLAIAHVSAAIPNFIAMEFHFIDEPHWAGMIAGDWPVIEEGYMTIPDKPGLGIEVDWEFVKRNLIEASERFFASI